MRRLKNRTVISIWLLVGFHPAAQSVQSTPADNTRKRVWQYIKKEKKRKKESLCSYLVMRPGISGTCQTVLYLPCHAIRYEWDLSNSFCTYLVMRSGMSGTCQTAFVLTLSCDQV